jgi:glycosyltransferase involved in cell wall biosynthesis
MAGKKVAYLSPFWFDKRSCPGSGERCPINWARGVAAGSRGTYAVELISYADRPGLERICPGVTLRLLPAAHQPRLPLDVVSWELPAAIADADLVHVHQVFTRSSEMALLVAKQQRKPVCVTDHGGHSSRLGLYLGSLELADRIVCQSDFAADVIRNHAASTPIEVIKGGVHSGFFRPPEAAPPRDRVLYVGRLLPHKGIDRLLQALPPELPLTLCGPALHEDYLRQLRSLAAGKQVQFVFEAGDETVRELYRRAWAAVLPSVYHDCYGHNHPAPELMGHTLLEAMACGTPAICSRVGGMPEFVRHGETGFVYDDLAELREYLSRLAGDPNLVEALGQRARQVVALELDYRAVGAKLVALYEHLIHRAREVAA